MDDQRDTRRTSCCVCSDKHRFGLPGVPREHGGRGCPVLEYTDSCFSLAFLNLSEELSLRVYTNYKSGSDLDSRLRAIHASFVFTHRAEPQDFPIDTSRWAC